MTVDPVFDWVGTLAGFDTLLFVPLAMVAVQMIAGFIGLKYMRNM